jgi:hypothetical protein
MTLAEVALDQCWNTFPNTQQLPLPSQAGFFDVTKRGTTAMDVTTAGQNSVKVPREAFVGALAYLIKGGYVKGNPCEIRNKYDNPGPLAQAGAVNGTQMIQYVLPILKAMGLVEINSDRPNTTWLV